MRSWPRASTVRDGDAIEAIVAIVAIETIETIGTIGAIETIGAIGAIGAIARRRRFIPRRLASGSAADSVPRRR